MTGQEQVSIPITVYRRPDGSHTCSSDWPGRKVCPFLMTRKMGTDDRCFWDYDRPLMRDEDGMGWLIPGDKCPLKEVEK